MQKLIDIFNNNSILIILCIIVLIIVALFVVLLLERKSKQKYLDEFNKYDNEDDDSNYEATIEDFNSMTLEENSKEEVNYEQSSDISKERIVYEKEKTPNEAKKAIEEAAKKLVYEEEQEIIGPTSFEKMQEETSIISYDELVHKNIDFDASNEKVLEDDGHEPITLDELYSFKEQQEKEEQESSQKETSEPFKIKSIDETSLDVKEDVNEDKEEMVYYTNSESKKFKNSDVISPVFGIKRDVIYKKEYNELGETIDIKALDLEIKKTEEFLKELKKLKDRLD